jgi:hypothetical protein
LELVPDLVATADGCGFASGACESCRRASAPITSEHAKSFAPDTPKARIDAYFQEQLRLQPATAGASAAQRTFREPLWILAGLAALLVLMACANVANLLLARAMTRRIEMALRLSIGAARRRLVQMMLAESLVLALVAASVGALFASWAAPFVVSMLAPPEQPLRLILDLDWRTLLIASSLTVAVTMLFGLLPAIRASATPLLDALKEVRGQHGHRRLAGALVAAQTAFCVFLLFGASLFIGTLDRLQQRPLGFTPDHLLHVVVEGTRNRSSADWAQLAAALRDVPRVEAAAVAAGPRSQAIAGGLRSRDRVLRHPKTRPTGSRSRRAISRR